MKKNNKNKKDLQAKESLTFENTHKRVFPIMKFVDKVVRTINEVCCISVMCVDDNSKISDFLYEFELEELRESLKVPISFNDYVVDVAERLKNKKTGT